MGDPIDADRLQSLYRTEKGVRSAGLTREKAGTVYGSYLDFATAFTSSGRVLDVGCGAGWSTLLFAERGYDATGIDLNPAAFEPPSHSRLTLLEGSALSIPFPDASFDLVTAYQTLEHVPDPGQMLGEMLRVVRPGGVVCVVGPNLLGLAGYIRGIGYYVWQNRPWWTTFIRTHRMPRHPFGNTVPEIIGGLLVAIPRIARKSLHHGTEFTMRDPDLRPPFEADNDATYLCNPIDLVGFFRCRGCKILRDVAIRRGRWTRMLATGTWVAVRTPAGTGPVGGALQSP
jgi:SAM-dependent methyltransferase